MVDAEGVDETDVDVVNEVDWVAVVEVTMEDEVVSL